MRLRICHVINPRMNESDEESRMAVTFNHTIIAAKDRVESARFYCEPFELDEAPSWGLFTNGQLDGGVLLQFAEPPVDSQMRHYAFLVDDELFDRAYRRLCERGIEHWADPQLTRPGRIKPNTAVAACVSGIPQATPWK